MAALSFKTDFLGTADPGGGATGAGSEGSMVWGVPKDALTPFAARFLTEIELRDVIGIFTDTRRGLVPLAPGGDTAFLREDGNWVEPEVSTGGGGFTTQIVDTSAQIDLSSSANGVHYRLRVAAPLRLMADAPVGTRAAVTPASTGTTSVTVEGGAIYRLPPTDDPDDAGRTAAFNANDYTEFECIRNIGNAAAEWDVWGVPAGTETTLAGTLDLNAQTIIPGAPVALTLTGGRNPYLASDSGKTFEVTGTGTAASHVLPSGLPAGWTVDIYNGTASSFLINGPGATDVTLTAGQVATVKVLNGGRVRVSAGATTLTS